MKIVFSDTPPDFLDLGALTLGAEELTANGVASGAATARMALARPVSTCMPLMTARRDRSLSDVGCDSDRVVAYEICHRDSSLRDPAGFESVGTLIDA